MIGAGIVWVKMGSKVIRHVCDYGVPDCVERPTRVYWRKRVPQLGETMKVEVMVCVCGSMVVF